MLFLQGSAFFSNSVSTAYPTTQHALLSRQTLSWESTACPLLSACCPPLTLEVIRLVKAQPDLVSEAAATLAQVGDTEAKAGQAGGAVLQVEMPIGAGPCRTAWRGLQLDSQKAGPVLPLLRVDPHHQPHLSAG